MAKETLPRLTEAQVRKLAPHMQGQPLLVCASPAVAEALAGEEVAILEALSSLVGSDIRIRADAQLHQEQFDVVPV